MWNLSNLWKKHDSSVNQDIKDDEFPTETYMPSFLLTELSPRNDTPSECPIRLWPHQEAMLYRIHEIESKGLLCKTEPTDANRYMDKSTIENPPNVCLGIMNDPPGSGKTYAILTAILTDNTGVSVIIVPQNIYGQWRSSIEVVFEKRLDKCKFSNSYMDVLDIYGDPKKILDYQVVLLQDSFAEAFLKVINHKEIAVRRIVIDEIDIMDKFVCSSVKTDYVWLMSASYKGQKRLGPYFIEHEEGVICKCEPSFVKQSLQIPEPILTVQECDDEHIQLFDGILEDKQLQSIHAGDFQIINRLMNLTGGIITTPYNMKEIATKYSDYLFKKTNELQELRDMLQQNTYSDEHSQKEYNILKKSISQLETKKKHAELLKNRLDELPDMQQKQVKEKWLEEDYVKEMMEKKESKWLIFNDNGNTLIRYQNFLNSKEIKTTMLDGGNQKRIEKALEDYKKGDTQVLLLNSMIEGAGMNLENTTHLLFMHKTQEKFIDQVVGRAQRYGRSTPLEIIMLFNRHE